MINKVLLTGHLTSKKISDGVLIGKFTTWYDGKNGRIESENFIQASGEWLNKLSEVADTTMIFLMGRKTTEKKSNGHYFPSVQVTYVEVR